jgi:hypothetical protein
MPLSVFYGASYLLYNWGNFKMCHPSISVKNISLINVIYLIFDMTRKKTFYVLILSGIAFIIISTASMIDSNIPRKVALDSKLNPSLTDIVTPIMNKGSVGKIIIDGSKFDFKIEDPDKSVIVSVTNRSNYEYNLIANKGGEFRVETKNTGNSVLNIEGEVETKASYLAFGGQMMLLITGIIVLGIGIKSKIA